MGYKVVVTSDAEKDFDRFIQYLLFEKKNVQAAQSVLNILKQQKRVWYKWQKVLNYVKIHVYKCLGIGVLIFCHIGILCYIE